MQAALAGLPELACPPDAAARLLNGNAVPLAGAGLPEGALAWASRDGAAARGRRLARRRAPPLARLRVRLMAGSRLARRGRCAAPRRARRAAGARRADRCVAACLWAFVELADEVVEGETARLRHPAAARAAQSRPTRPTRSGPAGSRSSAATSPRSAASASSRRSRSRSPASSGCRATAARCGWCCSRSRGGQALSSLAKAGFDRPRPDLVPHGMQVYTASFPSGHAMMAAVTYLTLGALVARVQPTRALKAYVLTLAVARHRRGRGQPGLPRRPLADRRPRRLDRRRRLGARLLAGRLPGSRRAAPSSPSADRARGSVRHREARRRSIRRAAGPTAAISAASGAAEPEPAQVARLPVAGLVVHLERPAGGQRVAEGRRRPPPAASRSARRRRRRGGSGSRPRASGQRSPKTKLARLRPPSSAGPSTSRVRVSRDHAGAALAADLRW